MKRVSSLILFSIIIIFLFLIVEQSTIWCLAENNVTFGCVPGEKKALLKFRESLLDPSNRLSSWNTNYDDCCTWKGVECNKSTGHVTGLHLQNRDVETIYDDHFHPNWGSMLRSKTIDSSSLLELKHLSYLDLSWNDFQQSSIPASLGSMKHLRHLNLSHANFSGIVPHQLGNLSSLHTLDLNSLQVDVNNLVWANNLSSLEYLDMSGVDLSRTKDIIKVLSMLPSIVVLRMSSSGLYIPNLPHTCLLNSTQALFSKVQHLDLSMNLGFGGEIPCFLQNMTSLSYLDLSFNFFHSHPLKYKSDGKFDLLGDKCHLKSLDLTANLFYGDISGVFKNTSGCWSHNLESLGLGVNNFDGHFPEELCELKQLTKLDLHENQLRGEIPISVGQLLNLEVIDISQNKFSGPIPATLGNLTNLRVLNIEINHLSGEVPISIGQLSNLERIDISYNKFNGHLPEDLGELKQLTWLDVSHNKFFGLMPTSLLNLTTLRALYIQNNQLSGEVPITLGQLSNLEMFDISQNSFEGTLSEAHFANLSRLYDLSVEYNMLEFKVGYDWMPPFQLIYLGIRSTNLGGQFPQWLQTQKFFGGFDLSDCGIKGTLPKWLNSASLKVLYLRGNHIEGPITELPSSLEFLDLSDNMIHHFPTNIAHMIPLVDYLSLARNFINGSIPDSLCEMKALGTLDLSGNQLSGILPDCWGNFKSLDVVRLSSNLLSGAIPNSIGGAYLLSWLHLDNNNFTGQIPYTLKNCTMLAVLDVGDNKLSGELPEWIGDQLLNLVILRLRNNEFYGVIPSMYCKPSQLQIVDLANNNLTGNIPRCFGSFTRMVEGVNHSAIYRNYGKDEGWMYESLNEVMKGVMREFTKTIRYVINLDLSCNRLVGEIPSELTNLTGLIGLNFSHNHLGGKIPRNVGDMKSLESLDLSSNNLSGTIPQSLSKLNFITHLDLSNNDLSGQIPTGPQLQTLDNTSNYGGNPGLCGPPLQKKCHIDETTPKVQNDAEDGDAADKFYLCTFIISGLATGFWGYFGVLVFKKSWRLALFRYMDVVIGKMLGRY